MDEDISQEKITLQLAKPEALILFELLADFQRQPSLRIRDGADRLSLIRLYGALQSTLVEPFSKDYDRIIATARDKLLQQWGTVS